MRGLWRNDVTVSMSLGCGLVYGKQCALIVDRTSLSPVTPRRSPAPNFEAFAPRPVMLSHRNFIGSFRLDRGDHQTWAKLVIDEVPIHLANFLYKALSEISDLDFCSSNFHQPRPLMSGFGSSIPITISLTPRSISRRQHGVCLPRKVPGSSVEYTTAPATTSSLIPTTPPVRRGFRACTDRDSQSRLFRRLGVL